MVPETDRDHAGDGIVAGFTASLDAALGLAGDHEVRYIGVKGGKPAVESGQSTAPPASQLGEVGISHLSPADDSFEGDLKVAQVVGPKRMPRQTYDSVQKTNGRFHPLTVAEDGPNQAALGDRTRREGVRSMPEPIEGRPVMNVSRGCQGYQHVGIE